MNCKQGDRAIIVSAPHRDVKALIGRIVRVTRLCAPTAGHGPTWRIEHELRCRVSGYEMTFYGVADRDLRPLPGEETIDDAVFEVAHEVEHAL